MSTIDIPVSQLCDERLVDLWNSLEIDSQIGAEAVAEDESERALYGDGPCGSMARRQAYNKVNKQLDEVRGEWYRRYPLPVQPITPDYEIPF